jgi:hypothetical protein
MPRWLAFALGLWLGCMLGWLGAILYEALMPLPTERGGEYARYFTHGQEK